MELKNRKIDEIITFLSRYLHGKDKALQLALTTFFSRGHLLVEDAPGISWSNSRDISTGTGD